MILIITFGEYAGEKPYIQGVPRLPYENTDFAHIVVNRVNTAKLMPLPIFGSPDPFASLK